MTQELKSDTNKNIIQHIWKTSSIVIALIAILSIILLIISFKLSNKIDKCSIVKHDTIYIEKIVTNDTHIPLILNQIKEDSLQIRISKVLDSLSILEDKLKFLQSNSSSSIDLIISIADSIEFYRKETSVLKKQIEKINKDTDNLLKTEREKNEKLRKRLDYYEKRLTALYALNLDVVMYSDGYDQNNKLITTNKAKKIEEINISFQLSRELEDDDEDIGIEITQDTKVLFVFNKVNPNGRQINRRFKVTSVTKLDAGKYTVSIYHDFPKYEIKRAVIGQTIITLE